MFGYKLMTPQLNDFNLPTTKDLTTQSYSLYLKSLMEKFEFE